MRSANKHLEQVLNEIANLAVLDRLLHDTCQDLIDASAPATPSSCATYTPDTALRLFELLTSKGIVPSLESTKLLLALEQRFSDARGLNLLARTLCMYCDHGHASTALELYDSNATTSLSIDTQSMLLKAALRSNNDDLIRRALQVISHQQPPPLVTVGDDNHHQRHMALLTQALVAAHCRVDDFEQASQIIAQAESHSKKQQVVASAVDAFAHRGDAERVEMLLQYAEQHGLQLGVESYAALISAHSKRGNIDQASQVIASLGEKGIVPTAECYAPMLMALANNDGALRKHAADVIRESVRKLNLEFTPSILQSMLHSRKTRAEAVLYVSELIHKDASKFVGNDQLMRDALTRSIQCGLISNYSRLLQLASAHNAQFSRLTCVSIVKTLLRQHQHHLASEFLAKEMKRNGYLLDTSLFNVLVPSYCHANSLESAEKMIARDMASVAVPPDNQLYHALLHESYQRGASAYALQLLERTLSRPDATLMAYLLWAHMAERNEVHFKELLDKQLPALQIVPTFSIFASTLQRLALEWRVDLLDDMFAFASANHMDVKQLIYATIEHLLKANQVRRASYILARQNPEPTEELFQLLVDHTRTYDGLRSIAPLLPADFYATLPQGTRANLLHACSTPPIDDQNVLLAFLACELRRHELDLPLLQAVHRNLSQALGQSSEIRDIVEHLTQLLQPPSDEQSSSSDSPHTHDQVNQREPLQENQQLEQLEQRDPEPEPVPRPTSTLDEQPPTTQHCNTTQRAISEDQRTISALAKRGQVAEIRQVIETARSLNQAQRFMFHELLRAYSNTRTLTLDVINDVYREMLAAGICPTRFTVAIAIRSLLEAGNIQGAHQCASRARQQFPDIDAQFLDRTLFDALVRTCPDHALQQLHNIVAHTQSARTQSLDTQITNNNHDADADADADADGSSRSRSSTKQHTHGIATIPWPNALVALAQQFCHRGRFQEASQVLFQHMPALGILPSSQVVYRVLLQMCNSDAASVLQAHNILMNRMHAVGLPVNMPMFHTVAIGWLSHGKPDQALEVLDEARRRNHKPNCATYRVLLHIFAKRADVQAALRTWHGMVSNNITPLPNHYRSMIEAWCAAGEPENALEFAHKHADNYRLDQRAFAMVLKGFASLGDIESIERLVRSFMPEYGVKPDDDTLISTMRKLLDRGHAAEALQLFELAKQLHSPPRIAAYNVAIQALLQLGHEHQALQMFNTELEQHNVLATIDTYNVLLHYCAQTANADLANRLLRELQQHDMLPDATSYHHLIAANYKNGMNQQALDYLVDMFDRHVQPRDSTWQLAFEILAQRGDVHRFIQALDEYEATHRSSNTSLLASELCSRLVIAYCQSGRTGDAHRVVNMMEQANIAFEPDKLDLFSREYALPASVTPQSLPKSRRRS
jgi:pentatricopeptide repeat protein